MEFKNAIESLVDMYKGQVEENDKRGYSETFKKCSELFFKEINEEYCMKDNPVNFEDIEYQDGYFIFGHGTNSVVHFHIKECPGWLFGIWWTIPEGNDKSIDGNFFAQYEEDIDKFKPSASIIKADIYASPENDTENHIEEDCNCWNAAREINFIRNEPYLAFCRHYNFWDYNIEHHTRAEAKKVFMDYKRQRKNEIKYTKILNDKILDFVQENIVPLYYSAKIVDQGECVSPRYELRATMQANGIDEPGVFTWFDPDDEGDVKLDEEFRDLIEECESIAEQHDLYWSVPIHQSIYLYDENLKG